MQPEDAVTYSYGEQLVFSLYIVLPRATVKKQNYIEQQSTSAS
jgi:hypothetical protein